MEKYFLRTLKDKKLYSSELYARMNKYMSRAEFIEFVFEMFLTEKTRCHYETKEELDVEKCIKHMHTYRDYIAIDIIDDGKVDMDIISDIYNGYVYVDYTGNTKLRR